MCKLNTHVNGGEPSQLTIDDASIIFVTELKKSKMNHLKYFASCCISKELGWCDVCDKFIGIENCESVRDKESSNTM